MNVSMTRRQLLKRYTGNFPAEQKLYLGVKDDCSIQCIKNNLLECHDFNHYLHYSFDV